MVKLAVGHRFYGQAIETVLLGFKGRHTACLSTQAGCAMGCVFCATGQMGFVWHLRPGEIVAQVLRALDAHVNLIPLNPTGGFGGLTTAAGAPSAFQQVLKTAGVPSTVLQRRGIDVAAGCGQLSAEKPGPQVKNR